MSLLAQLNKDGTAVLVASHNMHVVEKLGFRTVTLDHGEVKLDKPAVVQEAGE